MRASAIEFRFRLWIMVGIIAVGFWAPWIGYGGRFPLWGWLALEASRKGLLPLTTGLSLALAAGALIAAVGVALRLWGTAWLGYGTVHSDQMKAVAVMADGPYRYVRNPLYLGGWCSMAASAFLMPPTGALVSMTLLTVFFLRLILGEEAFLSNQLGQPYREYLRAVPRLIPQLRTSVFPSGGRPRWLFAVFTEISSIGIFVALAFCSWSLNNWLMLKAILISFGISMVVRGLVPREGAEG